MALHPSEPYSLCVLWAVCLQVGVCREMELWKFCRVSLWGLPVSPLALSCTCVHVVERVPGSMYCARILEVCEEVCRKSTGIFAENLRRSLLDVWGLSTSLIDQVVIRVSVCVCLISFVAVLCIPSYVCVCRKCLLLNQSEVGRCFSADSLQTHIVSSIA